MGAGAAERRCRCWLGPPSSGPRLSDQPGRRLDCHSADIPSTFLLKNVPKGQVGAEECQSRRLLDQPLRRQRGGDHHHLPEIFGETVILLNPTLTFK